MTATHAPVALITGGSTGIGAATARQLLDRGWRVAVTARRADRLRRLSQDLGAPDGLLTLPGDASDERDVRASVEGTLEAYGRLDAVVANAGYATHDTLEDGDPSAWGHMILTNVLGPALLVNLALPALERTGGRIVFVGSVAGFVHGPGNIYGATKWAVTGLAENTRLVATHRGVGVTLVAPGRTESAFWDAIGGAPDGRNLTSDELAASIVWALTQPAGVDVNTIVVRPIGMPV